MEIQRRALFAAAGALALWPGMGFAQAPKAAAEDLVAGFQSPPQAARPRVWWHWLNGNVTREGAMLDLEWMKRIGLGGVHTFSGGLGAEPALANPRSPFMSPQWQATFRDTTRIAADAGLEVGIAGSPGWSETGGVFVAPADAMKKYVWSTTEVAGGRRFAGVLAHPPVATGPFLGKSGHSRAKNLKEDLYGDALVVAFPTPAGEGPLPDAAYQSSAGAIDLSPIAAGDLARSVELPITAGGETAWVQATYASPVRIGSLTLATPTGAKVEILVSDDGQSFRPVGGGAIARVTGTETPAPQQTLAFAPVSARMFRVVMTALSPTPPLPHLPPAMARTPPPPRAFVLEAFRLQAGARVHRFEAKAGFQSTLGSDARETPEVGADLVVRRDSVVDLTSRMKPDGSLAWTPPPGRWTVLRFGWTLTGQTNGPAEPEATGLEVDKLDAAAVGRYADAYLGMYGEALGGSLRDKGVQSLLTDSWEAGFQNWTPRLLEEFRRRRGYDPTPYTPALAGRVVDSAEATERFLWDYRLTLKELVADAHFGVLAAALHERGLTYYTEASGDNPRVLGDGMAIKGRSDIPTAEYWYRNFGAGTPDQLSLKADLEEAASAAHVYGKPLVAAEALTVAAGDDPWSFSPRMLKPVADEIFAHGVNRFLLHESRQQPLVDAKPGVTLAIFGQYFNRNETWAEDAGPWVSYLARTSYLLQQGRFVADVAYFYGEDRNLTELFGRRLNTDVPPGYRYDYINREALLTLLSVKDGRIVTPSGMSYRLLFMPESVTRLTVPALSKLRELVAAGAVLVGPKPAGGLGLTSPDSDVAHVAEEVWGAGPIGPGGRRSGSGKVYRSLAEALAGEKIAPDYRFEASKDARLLALHRRTGDADIYFVSNQRDRAEDVQAVFRVTGKAPEIWRAETGAIEPTGYRAVEGGTETRLRLEPEEAVFVVFRKAATQAAWSAPAKRRTELAAVEGPWHVAFGPGLAAPPPATYATLRSWSESAVPAERYYSGSATYRATLTVKPDWRKDGRLLLDLGDVRELAAVEVNGKRLGTVWHAPYRLDVTDALRAGKNELAIRVVNLWPNRLIGDRQPGAKPVTFAPASTYRADSALLASGLLGPVRLLKEEVAVP